MTDIKQQIIENLCYTELVYKRINKKLLTEFSNGQIELLIKQILKKTDEKFYTKTGKNFYVTNTDDNIRITINSNTFRVITADKIEE
jgi:RNA binding exosome subunit